ncbi:hypothetical protein [Methyloceanibacter sp.]|uniref:hypothetical protein n=1 Tax=Methyloceanibacter sp. TaxID=1965321 RepID=UPI003D6CDCED
MAELPDYLKQGDVARLIPAGAANQKERSACSVLLSSLRVVQPYARTIFGEIRQKVGNGASIDAYTEAIFKIQPEGLNCRHDGLLILDTGRRQWRAIVESKIGTCKIEPEQLAQYARLARANKVNAIITISNELTPRPDHIPYAVPKEIRNLELYHWSWPYLAMRADLLLGADLDFDYEQNFILREVVRYLDHDSTDIKCFTQMPSGWSPLIQRIGAAASTPRGDPDLMEAVRSWHQAQASICIRLTRELQLPVTPHLSRGHRDDQDLRLSEEAAEFAADHVLRASFDFPKLPASIEVVANALARNVICRFWVDARQDRQRYQARLRWLINQLPAESDPSAVITCVWDRGVKSDATLGQLRENLNAARIDGAGAGPAYFEIATVSVLGSRFVGTKNFVPAVEEAVRHFYETIARHIRPWQGHAAEEDVVTEESAEVDDQATTAEPKRKIVKRGEVAGRAYSIYEDGSIEIQTGNGVQRFNSFAELTAAAAAKNGHADGSRPSGRGSSSTL